jgi:hypothetical protein
MREFEHQHDRVRIPIRKWEKVETHPFTGEPLGPYTTRASLGYGFVDDTYRLEVVINGSVLCSTVKAPQYLQQKDVEQFRKHIVNSLSAQIAGVIADEIRRSIV